MSTKRDQITTLIQQRGEGYRVNAREIAVLAMECECSMQHVRAVRADLRAGGVLDENNCYVGRWVQPKELAAYLRTEDDMHVGLLLSNSRKTEMARHFQTTERKLYQAIQWAISSRLIEERFSYYGWHLLAA